jgi:hypothetical protein
MSVGYFSCHGAPRANFDVKRAKEMRDNVRNRELPSWTRPLRPAMAHDAHVLGDTRILYIKMRVTTCYACRGTRAGSDRLSRLNIAVTFCAQLQSGNNQTSPCPALSLNMLFQAAR